MKRYLLVSAAAFALGVVAFAQPAQAQEMGTLSYVDVSEKSVRDNYHGWKVFMEYHMVREQCQGYQVPPAGYKMVGCNFAPARQAAAAPVMKKMEEPKREEKPAPAAFYTIHFGLDSAVLGESEEVTIKRAADDIKKSDPAEVKVSGFTSTAGTTGHNDTLSEKRAQAVTDALVKSGVDRDIIEQKGYGETHLAVPTEDGVRMPPNRRATIEFNR